MDEYQPKTLEPTDLTPEQRQVVEKSLGQKVVHGICRGNREDGKGRLRPCSRRTVLWLPARLCEKCLMSAATDLGLVASPASADASTLVGGES